MTIEQLVKQQQDNIAKAIQDLTGLYEQWSSLMKSGNYDEAGQVAKQIEAIRSALQTHGIQA
jgi:flagellar biosynthesis/type III secretory pathway ATPase